MITIGIDPGLSGAIGVLDHTRAVVGVYDMPIEPRTKTGKNQVDAHELQRILATITGFHPNTPIQIWVELVSAMPGQGVTSMFTFGEGCGVIRGIVTCSGFPFNYVSPVKWKKALDLVGKDKQFALTRAKQLIPSSAEHLTRKRDVGRADALLIAYFGMKANAK